MTSTKVKIDRFDGKGDFSLWKKRMEAVLCQMKVSKALEGKHKLPASMTQDEKTEAMELAYSTLILHLGDKVLREVSREKTAAGIWTKLESLYMTSMLTYKIYLKGKLFGFKMDNSKPVEEFLDDFAKIIIDLENIKEKIEDEDQAIMILNVLPPEYSTLVKMMKYARETISMEEVLAALKSKHIESKTS
ncbi:unnamed protein product [Rhodiola kirilowii]